MFKPSRTRRGALFTSTALVVALGIESARADDPTMTDLGTLGGNSSQAVAVSANGSVIVGTAFNAAGDQHAASWSNGATTPADLGTLGGSRSQALAVSADGKAIVGDAFVDATGASHAVLWSNGATTPTDLGTLGGNISLARAISADDLVIVGYARTAAGDYHAASWSNGATTPTDLGTLGGVLSNAWAVSANGKVIVGYAYDTAGNEHAASWSNGVTTPTDLGTLGGSFSEARAVSADGTVIAGNSYNAASEQHAVSWRNGATTPTDLGTLGGDGSTAIAMSADGSVIIGQAQATDGNYRAVSWSNGATAPTDLGAGGGSTPWAVSANGKVIAGYAFVNDTGTSHAVAWSDGATTPTDLGTLGGTNSQARAVSADGSVVVGYSDTAGGGSHAFAVRLKGGGGDGGDGGDGGGGTPPPIIQDLDNMRLSVPLMANDTAVAFDRQVGVMGSLLGAQCLASSGEHWCLGTSLSGFTVSGQQNALTGTMALGYAATDRITIGGTIAVTTKGRIDHGAIDIAAAPAFGLWTSYSQGGASGTGFQGGLAFGYGETHADLTRGLGLDNVVPVAGRADLATFGAQASVGYGFTEGNWLVTPSLALATYHMSRAAYDEDTGADFPAQYDKLTGRLTTATLSLGGSRAIGGRQRIGLGAGLVADLDYRMTALAGTSSIPGLASFAQPATLGRHKVRPFLSGSYSVAIDTRSTVSIGASISRAAYGDTPAVGLNLGFSTAF